MKNKTSVNKKQKQEQKTVAEKAIEKITEKEESRKDKLMSLVPEGHSPAVYIDLIKKQVLGTTRDGKERPDEDLMLFMYNAKRTGLDPLARQIYAVYRWDSRIGADKMTIQSGIDGFRLIAQRSGGYAGQDDAIFSPEDESSPYPIKATVTVYKMIDGQRVPFTATARWNEYVSTNKDGQAEFMWKKMPYLMLAKCAESLALRKAFPNELSGIYSEEEMAQSKNILADLPAPDKTNKIQVDFGSPEDTRPVIHKDTEVVEAEKHTDDAKNVTEQNKQTEVKNVQETDLTAIRAKLKENDQK